MLGFAIFAVGLVFIVLWIRHDHNKPCVPSRSTLERVGRMVDSLSALFTISIPVSWGGFLLLAQRSYRRIQPPGQTHVWSGLHVGSAGLLPFRQTQQRIQPRHLDTGEKLQYPGVLCLVLGLLLGGAWASDGCVLQPIRTAGLGSLNFAEFSPTEDIYFTASGNGLQLWTVQGVPISAPIAGSNAYAGWSPDGTRIAAALDNGSYRLLSSQGRVLSRREGVSPGIPRWVGSDAVTMTVGERLRFWALENGTLLGEIEPPSNMLGSAWSRGLLAITYGGEDYLYVYHLGNWSVAAKIPVTGQVLTMAWDPEGTRLAYSPYGEETLHIWDAQTRQVVAQGKVERSLGRVAWSQDGSLLAVSAWGWIRIFDGTDLDPLISLESASPQTLIVSWSPDGTKLLTGSMDGTVALFDVARTQASLSREIDGSISRIRFSSTGLLALALKTGEVRCYSSLDMDQLEFSFTLPGGAISSLDWATDSTFIAAGSDTGLLGTYSSTGRLEGRWTAHQGAVEDTEWRPDGGILASVGEDGYLAFWDTAGSQMARLQAESELSKKPRSLAWSPDGSMVATGYEEGPVRIWSYPGLEIQRSPSRRGPFGSLEWAPHEAHLGVDILAGAGHEDGLVLVWDAWGTAGRYEDLRDHDEMVTDLSWSSDGSILATCSRNGEIRLWEMVKRDLYGTESVGGMLELVSVREELTSVDISPEGYLLAASRSGHVYRWSSVDRLLWSMRNHTTRIRDLSWSPDSERVAYNSGSQELGICDRFSGVAMKCDLGMVKETSLVMCLDWSPNGMLIAVGEYEAGIRVLDQACHQIFEIEHEGGVFCLEWSPDSHYLASAGADRNIRIWDGSTGGLVATLSGHSGIIISLSWSRDGRWLVSGSQDGSVRIWDMDTGTLAKSHEVGDQVLYAALSPDTSLIAAVTYDFEAGMGLSALDTNGGVVWTRTIRGSSGDVDWSPDGEYLVVPTSTSTMVFSKGDYLLCNLSWPCWADRVEWSPDGEHIATGGYDGVLKLYDAAPIRDIPQNTPPAVLAAVTTLSTLLASEQIWRKGHNGQVLVQ